VTDSSNELGQPTRLILQIIYDLLRQRGTWPTFRTVDLRIDRLLHIEDGQAALAAVPGAYLQRAWHAHGFYDTDEVRLSLRGVQACEGGPEDLQLLADFMSWLTETEQSQDPSEESDLTVTSVAFAESAGLRVEATPEDHADAGSETEGVESDDPASESAGTSDVVAPVTEETDGGDPDSAPDHEIEENRATLARLRMLAELLPRFWGGAGWQENWRWQYTIDRQMLRPYRHINGVEQLLDYADQWRLELEQRQAMVSRQATSASIAWNISSPEDAATDVGSPTAAEVAQVTEQIDVFLTLLRPEIVEAAAGQLRGRLYDDAIFAAYRRVESRLQERAGLPGTIGDLLVRQAFDEIADPIRISARPQDSQRLIELFCGALGLLKGDRSHKDKPALPCRSMRECLRQLAHASALLDLLDRDIAVAPGLHGFDHRGDTLELWVDRASAQSQVWLDDHLCEVISYRPGNLAINVTGIPSGEHDLSIIDGTRASPITQIWLAPDPPRKGWYRISEVNIPLFSDERGAQRLDVSGLRLTILESGLETERIVQTSGSYGVGDYVEWHNTPMLAAPEAGKGLLEAPGPVWMRERPGGPPRQLFVDPGNFDGEPIAPAHEPRLMKVTLEPESLLLRLGEKAALRALGHYTDGVATWSKPLDNPQVTTSDDKVAFHGTGTVIAKGYGNATLRAEFDGRYGSAIIQVATHPQGTLADVLTGLPPVAGVAWAQHSLIVSTRTSELWRLTLDGKYQVAAGIPLDTLSPGGTDTVAAASDGDLAVRLHGRRDILVLDASSGYRKSRWVTPGEHGAIMAMTWDAKDLILALQTGVIQRVHPDGSTDSVTTLPQAPPVSIALADNALLVLTSPTSPRLAHIPKLWHIPLDKPDQAHDLLEDRDPVTANTVTWLQGCPYFTDFHGGRILRLEDSLISEVASGMKNPAAIAADPDNTIYVAEFGRGAVRRILAS
jgi:Protein of unknown function (Hypoth_ymh)